MIKLVALDLDGTTLRNDGHLSERTKIALESAISKGVQIVIATGRVLSALPKEILSINGICYALTSNGANIIDLKTRKPIYTNFLKSNVVKTVINTIQPYDFMTEAFIGGHAYIEKSVYTDVQMHGSVFNNTEYLLKTREPIENLFDFILENHNSIENINLNFREQKDRAMMRGILEGINDIYVTSSFDYNLEICGMTTSKADALSQLCKLLGLTTADVMACGDSYNDIEMLKVAGLPVAIGNAKDEVKAVAKCVVPTNEENGVALAIERLVLV